MRIKSQQVLNMLREGKSIKEITHITGAKVAAIKAHEKRLSNRGLWGNTAPKLDDLTDYLIDSLEKAKSVPDLLNRINRLENQKAALENELVVLRDTMNDKLNREMRYRLAIQQGELPHLIPSVK